MDYGFVEHDYHPAPAFSTYRCISSLIFLLARDPCVSTSFWHVRMVWVQGAGQFLYFGFYIR